MKLQDLIFMVVWVGLIILRKPKLLVIASLTCLFLSIPLFSFWIFFTAQRLTYYAVGFFAVAIIFLLFKNRK